MHTIKSSHDSVVLAYTPHERNCHYTVKHNDVKGTKRDYSL